MQKHFSDLQQQRLQRVLLKYQLDASYLESLLGLSHTPVVPLPQSLHGLAEVTNQHDLLNLAQLSLECVDAERGVKAQLHAMSAPGEDAAHASRSQTRDEAAALILASIDGSKFGDCLQQALVCEFRIF
jgi:hypothetical protein